MRREPRLQFTKEERENPALEKPIRKVDRAADRADEAQVKVPKRKVKQRTVDPETGAVTVRLQFEDKKPPSKLQHALRDAPADTVLGAVHREVRQSEADNVGVESAHKTEEAAESAGRLVRAGYRSQKLRPYRKAAAAERKLEKANVNALYQKSLEENPGLSSNPLSRWQQKQAIKRQYAAARRAGQTAATVGQTTAHTAQSTKKAAKKSRQAADFARRHKKGLLIAAGLFLVVAFFLNCMSSCSVLVQGGMSGIASTTYPSTDEAMLGAEAAYAGMEAELQNYLDTYESTHSYDEYHFDLDEIGHDPYVLISILTAYHQGEWTLDEVQVTLDMLFEKQYILTERVVVETRHDSEGDPYSWYICYVTLENTDLSHLPVYIMGEDQLSMYAVYMAPWATARTCSRRASTPTPPKRRTIWTTTCPRRHWRTSSLPPCWRRRRNTWATPMFGVGPAPPPPLTAPATCPGCSITAAGMWGGWGRRACATSAPPSPPPMPSRAIWCSSKGPMIRRGSLTVASMWGMA